MSSAQQWAAQMTVLHRAPGYLRLKLPAEMTDAEQMTALQAHVAALPGVHNALVDPAWKRLTVRYAPEQLSVQQVARHLFVWLVEQPPMAAPAPVASVASVTATDEQTAGIPGLQPLLDRFEPLIGSALTEKAITNFFNDIVAFYLVKTHWDLITKRWLQQPLAHSNAWLTVFYLVFLLIRYRKTP